MVGLYSVLKLKTLYLRYLDPFRTGDSQLKQSPEIEFTRDCQRTEYIASIGILSH